MKTFDWSHLNTLQVGRYAEYFVKMELTLHGFEVYTSEVDDRCVDFVVRRDGGQFYDIQVKASRGLHYVFIPKEKFGIAPYRIVALVILHEGEAPQLYLIPMTAWCEPNKLFVSRDYKGKKSKPGWGVSLAKRNLHRLRPYQLESVVTALV